MLGGSATIEPFTVMVKVFGSPGQECPPLAFSGVTVMVAVSCWSTLTVVKFRLPVPEAGKPIAGLEFVHVNVAPLPPLKLTLTGEPPHTLTSEGWFMDGGTGRTVTFQVCELP